MPTYDYECTGCGHRFEKFQSIKARQVRKCPQCGALKVRRIIGAGGAVIFRGSGFYTTDYRSEEYKKQASADKPPSDSKSGDDDSKSSSTKKGGKSAGSS